MAEHAHCHHDAAPGQEHGTMVTDPVCGMKVDARTAALRYRLGDTDYYFCSARCLDTAFLQGHGRARVSASGFP